MACYHPISAWQVREPNAKGKRPLLFKPSPTPAEPITVPCGQCIGCRLDRSKQWAIRCVHEASQHPVNCFITLTYNEESLPGDNSLHKRDFQLFMKKLRKELSPVKIRYFACGEYGTDQDLLSLNQLGRPHFHACIFGYNFEKEDRELFSTGDYKIYTSSLLERIWGKGFCTIGDLTFETAAYTARYIVDKINGDLAYDHYTRFDEETGEIQLLEPEFTTQSNRGGGIGANWFDKYSSDLDKDFLTLNGKKYSLPKYYDKLMERHKENKYLHNKEIRKTKLDEDHPDNTPERLASREKAVKLKLTRLKRNIQ